MSVKQGRTDSLSSCAKASVAIADSAKVGTISAGAETSRPDLMRVAFPVKFAEIGDFKIEGFLERCYYCKKQIAQNKEVFMYVTSEHSAHGNVVIIR
ncbi:hypothetical protein CASFOL_027152 [Castilleja foliolosa]|uniref:FLZ-type domain-containing protein n=1 Tax=Castilleja foliolosa TaxID=1961234 RepID=A0ABD3CGF5_9LAMI